MQRRPEKKMIYMIRGENVQIMVEEGTNLLFLQRTVLLLLSSVLKSDQGCV